MENFRIYLRKRLAERGVSKRRLSLVMHRDPSYVAQLLDPPTGTSRALPSPAELRLAAPVLGVPLVELLELAWGISQQELEADIQTVAAHRGVWAEAFADLSTSEREEVLNFIAYVKAKRAQAWQEAEGQQIADRLLRSQRTQRGHQDRVILK